MNYPVILADPPWIFSVWNAAKSNRHASHKYDLMSTDDICQLKIPASDPAVLFLWATWPNLPDALKVIEAWGFTYRSLAWVWVKLDKSGMGFFHGMGYYTRANSEPCLLAVRGTMPVAAHDVQALIVSPVQEHSRKPEDQFRKIERLYPDGPYLEMFARRKREGWDSWGNEIVSDVEIVSV